MKADEIEAALERGAWVSPPRAPSPLQPIAGDVAVDPRHVRNMAEAHRLIGDGDQLHCWGCSDRGIRNPIDWHVSLCCFECRAEERRTRSDRQRREWQDRQARDKAAATVREEEQSRPQQRVANRSFRDDR